MTVTFPTEIRSITLLTLADLIRSNEQNQLKFASCIVSVSQRPELSGIPSQKSPPAVPTSSIKALVSCCLDKEHFSLRAASCYALQAYVFNNSDAQIAITTTLVSPPGENPNSSQQRNK